jgi:hypothetical protein
LLAGRAISSLVPVQTCQQMVTSICTLTPLHIVMDLVLAILCYMPTYPALWSSDQASHRIWRMPGLNLSWDIGYPAWGLFHFSQSLREKFLTIFHILISLVQSCLPCTLDALITFLCPFLASCFVQVPHLTPYPKLLNAHYIQHCMIWW